jgi:Cas5fv helical domain
MRIEIEYDSCWQTSFLEPVENSSVDSRKFVATTKTRGQTESPITQSTILGILCRLIGDQRKLYQSKACSSFYFSGLEDKISFKVNSKSTTEKELVYLTNKSDNRCGQSTFMGVLSSDNPWFFSEAAQRLWSVLFLSKKELIHFVLGSESCKNTVDSTPKNLIGRLDLITDIKSELGAPLKSHSRTIEEKKNEADSAYKKMSGFIEKNEDKELKSDKQRKNYETKLQTLLSDIERLNSELGAIKQNQLVEDADLFFQLKTAIEFLSKKYDGCEYWSEGLVYPIRLYAAALYLQAERMHLEDESIDFVKNESGDFEIKGFSKRGFNGIRDWLNPMTGKRKKAVGTPCVIDKQSGNLEITIDVEKEKALEIEALIENAGVSAFYLGKKGLAYVSKIRV